MRGIALAELKQRVVQDAGLKVGAWERVGIRDDGANEDGVVDGGNELPDAHGQLGDWDEGKRSERRLRFGDGAWAWAWARGEQRECRSGADRGGGIRVELGQLSGVQGDIWAGPKLASAYDCGWARRLDVGKYELRQRWECWVVAGFRVGAECSWGRSRADHGGAGQRHRFSCLGARAHGINVVRGERMGVSDGAAVPDVSGDAGEP